MYSNLPSVQGLFGPNYLPAEDPGMVWNAGILDDFLEAGHLLALAPHLPITEIDQSSLSETSTLRQGQVGINFTFTSTETNQSTLTFHNRHCYREIQTMHSYSYDS
jgi:hypothetical protein